MRGRNAGRLAVAAALLLAACGGDSTGPGDNPGPSYQSIAGTYAGVLAGTEQGIDLTGTFSITVNQADHERPADHERLADRRTLMDDRFTELPLLHQLQAFAGCPATTP